MSLLVNCFVIIVLRETTDIFAVGKVHVAWVGSGDLSKTCHLLETMLYTFVGSMYPNNEGLFHQDNILYHLVQVVQNWFVGHSGWRLLKKKMWLSNELFLWHAEFLQFASIELILHDSRHVSVGTREGWKVFILTIFPKYDQMLITKDQNLFWKGFLDGSRNFHCSLLQLYCIRKKVMIKEGQTMQNLECKENE